MTLEILEKAKLIQNKLNSINSNFKIIEQMINSKQKTLSINVVEGLNLTRMVSLDKDTIGQDIFKLAFNYLLEEQEKLKQELKEL